MLPLTHLTNYLTKVTIYDCGNKHCNICFMGVNDKQTQKQYHSDEIRQTFALVRHIYSYLPKTSSTLNLISHTSWRKRL